MLHNPHGGAHVGASFPDEMQHGGRLLTQHLLDGCHEDLLRTARTVITTLKHKLIKFHQAALCTFYE